MSTAVSPTADLHAEQRRTRVLELSGTAHSKRDHDLRNLVYLIGSFTQLLSDGVAGSVTPRQKELLGHVLECTRGMRQLIDGRQLIEAAVVPTATAMPATGMPQPAAANS